MYYILHLVALYKRTVCGLSCMFVMYACHIHIYLYISHTLSLVCTHVYVVYIYIHVSYVGLPCIDESKIFVWSRIIYIRSYVN